MADEINKFCNVRFMNILDKIVAKISSTRSLVTLMVSATLCMAVLKSFDMVNSVTINKEFIPMYKEIFFYIMGVFSGVVGSVITGYFNRTDRATTNGNTPNETVKPKE